MSAGVCAVWLMFVLLPTLAVAQPDCTPQHLGAAIGNRHMPRVVGCLFNEVKAIFQQYGVTAVANAVYSGVPSGKITGHHTPVEMIVPAKGTVRLDVSSGPLVPKMLPLPALALPPSPPPSGADVSVISTTPANKGRRPGESMTFSFRVGNAGPGSTREVTIIPQDSRNFTVQGISGGCSKFPCVIPFMDVKQTVDFAVNGVVLGEGEYGVGVHVRGSVTDSVQDNNYAYGSGTTPQPPPSLPAGQPVAQSVQPSVVPMQSDLALSGTMTTGGPYHAGQTVTFSLAVTNVGPGTADGFQLTDDLTNLTRRSVTGGACHTMPCSYPFVLTSGTTTRFMITETVDAAGEFRALLSVMGGKLDRPSKSKRLQYTGKALHAVPADEDGQGVAPAATVVQHTVEPSLLSKPDLKLTLRAETLPPYRVGDIVSLTLNVMNEDKGLGAATTAHTITLLQTGEQHLALVAISGSCTRMPCPLASLRGGESLTVQVRERILQTGFFHADFQVTGAQSKSETANYTALCQGSVHRSLAVWCCVVLGMSCLAALGFGLQAKTRRERWRAQIRVTADVDLGRATAVLPVGLTFKLPPVSVGGRLVRGAAEPDGPFKIDREALSDE